MVKEEIQNSQYLLVSDSDETSEQFDSKKLSHQGLSELAQDELFKTHLDMSAYLMEGRYENLCRDLELEFNQIKGKFNGNPEWSGKYKVVDGQVIFIRKSEIDAYNSSETIKKSPLDYLKEHWDITSEFYVVQLTNCMICGMAIPSDGEQFNQVQKPDNQKVQITKETFPNHMHHSGITNETKAYGLGRKDDVGYKDGGVRYDMFNNDSLSSGLDKNELDGVVDKFEVKEYGDVNLVHNNMPQYEKFYVFEVRKVH